MRKSYATVDGALCVTVSIHARHYWRAKPLIEVSYVQLDGGFNPRPSLLAGETDPDEAFGELAAKFQSTPVITGGRNFYLIARKYCKASFNPRPSLLAGETNQMACIQTDSNCFNPRPSLLAGETGYNFQDSKAKRVSIHARHYWRAKPCVGAVSAGHAGFQSTPVITGGRNNGWPKNSPP